MSGKIIIISGPAGVGKSTTARIFAEKLKKSVYVNGDTVSHMSVAGREKPWESKSAHIERDRQRPKEFQRQT